MISLPELKRYVAAYPSEPPRTKALERRIQIGTGFHGKWYRSQQEHWLGWIVLKECHARRDQLDPIGVPAKETWNRLKCSPSMFWLAEAAGVPADDLHAAEQAAVEATKINPKDGHPHGKFMRKILPWDLIEAAILSGPAPLPDELATAIADEAFDRLIELRPMHRKNQAFRRAS